jgi:hypothetical protein
MSGPASVPAGPATDCRTLQPGAPEPEPRAARGFRADTALDAPKTRWRRYTAPTMRKILLFPFLLLLAAVSVQAEVSRVDIARRAPVGTSGYEKIAGTIHFTVDPRHPTNARVADIDKAPTNASGRVEFSADLYILRPLDPARSNGVALVDVVNRGRKMILSGFNRGGALDPATDADLGDGLLMRHGFTLVWVGWQFDVRRQNDLMSIDVPPAAGVTGIVRAEFTPNDREPETTVTDLAGYTPLDPDSGENTLTVRDGPFGKAAPVARDKWRIRGNVVTLTGGFEPGRTYEVAFKAANPPVAGLGLVALRDTTSWVKHDPGAPARTTHAIAFGSSQSGRFLRTFLYYGFNADERGRPVFDGVMAHIAGTGRLSINERWAIPNGLGMYTATEFPFADAAQRDPRTGKTEGLLDNDRARAHQPKVMYTNTGVEYWGGGRAAALGHTSPDGRTDLALPDNVRAYFLAGTQHSPGRFPPRAGNGQQPDNPVEYWWTMRALLVGMTRWVREGTPPPASSYPRLADGALVAADRVAFPAIHGVASPRTIQAGRDHGHAVPLLVPQVGEDGNERAGIRAPDVAVPLATYTGWNFRSASVGGGDYLFPLIGSAVPFARTKAARESAKDPRLSIAERYASRDEYLQRARSAADALVAAGYLLAADVPPVMDRAGAAWDVATGADR